MKQIIMDVLNDMSHSQVNLGSNAARKMVSNLISSALKSKGCYTEYDDSEVEEQNARETWVCSICGKNTADVDYDYLGSGTNHLSCELKQESQEVEEIEITGHDHGKVWPGTDAIQKQIYNEMTSDGLPEGGDAQAVLESHKLADEIVDNQEGKWIYESPDGGKTVFRRPFSDYDPKNKEEIDWKTGELTGRKFTEYNNGNWSNEDEG
jgi:hypothetical protein